jgi:MFS family permease
LTFSRRRLIPSVYAPSLLHAAGFGMLAPAIPLYAQQLEVSLGLIGVLIAVQGMGGMAIDIPAALLAARLGGRRAMALGLLAAVAGALALSMSTSPAHLFAAIPLVGVGTAAWATTRLSYVADVAPVEQRGRALAIVGGSSRIGHALGPIAGGLLGEAWGLPAVFLGAATLYAAALLGVWTSDGPRSSPAPEHSESAHLRLARTLVEHRREFATAGSVALSLALLRSARRVLVPLWGAAIGLDLAEIGLVIGLAAAVDMLLFYPVGVVMDRWGRKWTIIPCLVTLTASLAWMPLTESLIPFLLACLLGGFGNGLGSGAIMTMGADLAPRARAGEFLGVWRLISDAGGVLAPAVVGGVAQALTLGASFLATAAFGVAGALLMALVVPEGLSYHRDARGTESQDL